MREVITTTANGTSTVEVLDFVYGSGSTPLALVYTNGTANPVTYYYVTNMQGDVVKLVNASGATVANYTYDAWGKVLSATGSMAEVNPIRYRGYYYDAEMELYYLQSRYYDSVVKRFVNADAITNTGQGFNSQNMFAYCNNCPVSLMDSTGYAASRTFTTVINDGGGRKLFDAHVSISPVGFLVDAAVEVATAAVNSIEAYAGVGQGLNVGVEFDGISVDAGFKADYLGVKLSKGELTAGQKLYMGAEAQVLIWGIGPNAEAFIPLGEVYDPSMDEIVPFYDENQSVIPIYGNSAYFLFLGGSFEVGFDAAHFIDEVKGIKWEELG